MAKKRYYKKDAWMVCPKCNEIVSRKGMTIHKSRWCIHKTVIKSPNLIGGRVPFSVMKWYREEAKKRNINISELLRIIPSLIKEKSE